jgi:hypothetical protein
VTVTELNVSTKQQQQQTTEQSAQEHTSSIGTQARQSRLSCMSCGVAWHGVKGEKEVYRDGGCELDGRRKASACVCVCVCGILRRLVRIRWRSDGWMIFCMYLTGTSCMY